MGKKSRIFVTYSSLSVVRLLIKTHEISKKKKAFLVGLFCSQLFVLHVYKDQVESVKLFKYNGIPSSCTTVSATKRQMF